ncbi:DUF6328 family protein [Streptomyces sp. RPT161]|uniref:DUF6328 family protein n=1 Tax=Streptomyces sp. RPT161 TaxID=3015993 RepID=UPI003FCE9221
MRCTSRGRRLLAGAAGAGVRADRHLVQFLQELRVVQTGVQTLFAFMREPAFTGCFCGWTASSCALVYLSEALVGAGGCRSQLCFIARQRIPNTSP